MAYETLSEGFFRLIFGGDPTTGVVRDQFIAGIDRFEQLALLRYGNVKFGFKTLAAKSQEELAEELRSVMPIPLEVYTRRPPTLRSIEEIDPADTYYLGHMTGEAVAKGEDADRKRRMVECRRIGEANLTLIQNTAKRGPLHVPLPHWGLCLRSRLTERFLRQSTIPPQKSGPPQVRKAHGSAPPNL